MKNKKGKHYRIKFYKFITTKYYFLSILIYFSALIASLASLIGNIIIVCKIDYSVKDITSLVIACVAFTVALTAAIIKIATTARRSYFNTHIVVRHDSKHKIIESATKKTSKTYAASDYKWDNHGEQNYLYSDKIDDKLYENCKDLRITVNPKKQAMDSQQKEALYNIVCKKIDDGKSIFNSNMVRLRSDILLDLFKDEPVIKSNKNKCVSYKNIVNKQGVRKNLYDSHCKGLIKLEKTDYFYNISTNDQIYSTIFQFDYAKNYCGRDKSMDKDELLYDLAQSPAANIIGVTTFAITSDGYLLLNVQGEMNDVNNGCFVPSGSGSADFEDLTACKKYEPEELREQVNNLARGNLKNIKDSKLSEINNPKMFKKFKKQFLDEMKKGDLESDLNDSLAELAYKNATVTQGERFGFKKYKSSMKKYTYDFNTFLKYGMVRELIEETHLYEKNYKTNKKGNRKYRDITSDTRQQLINDTRVCGYIRILDRGGKPDFFGFTMLNLKLKEVQDMFRYGRNKVLTKEIKGKYKVTDFNEVSDLKFAKFENIGKYKGKGWETFIKNECGLDEDKKNIRISLQTYCLLNLLSKDGPKKEILDFIAKHKNDD